MNDPWHQETLEGLVATIEATKAGGGTAYAVVVVSSERLGGEVVGELRQRLGNTESLRVCTYTDPRNTVQRRLEEPGREGFRTTIIQGLPTVLESKHGEGLLGWLNFRRESFTRPGEAFVFVLTREAADRWAKEAPDLDRYTAHYDFEDWDDLVEAAERKAANTELVDEDGKTQLRQARRRLQQARKLGGDIALESLIEVARLERLAGLYVDAERTLAEAWSMAAGSNPKLRGEVVLARSYLLAEQGHPDAALQALRSNDAVGIGEAAMTEALGEIHRELAKKREASSYIRRHRELVHQDTTSGADAWKQLFIGNTQEFLEKVMAIVRHTLHLQQNAVFAAWSVYLAAASLQAARPRRCTEILDDLRFAPGSQSAVIFPFAIVRAEAQWVLDGPDSVVPIIHEEEQRQRGWTAPKPAAELVFVRGLAASSDEEVRRHLEDATSRFRTMEHRRHLFEGTRWLARLDRLHGDLDRAANGIHEGLAWHIRKSYRSLEARDRTELAMIVLGRRDPKTAQEEALQALQLIRSCGARLYEPAALLALAAAQRALGKPDTADVTDRRWRNLVRGIDAKGLEAALERDAAWAAAQTSS